MLRHFSIPEDNMPALTKKLINIRNKCLKHGATFEYHIHDYHYEARDPSNPALGNLRLADIGIEGVARVNGWDFIGRIEHTQHGNVVHHLDNSVEVPPHYLTTKPVCEHCGTTRARVYTYLLKNYDTGDIKQVGKSCLEEYTGGLDAAVCAAYESAIHDCETWQGCVKGINYGKYFPIHDVLTTACAFVDTFGYQRTDSENATRDQVLGYLENRPVQMDLAVQYNLDPSQYQNMSNDIVTWAAQLDTNQCERFTYLHSLKVLLAHDYINRKDISMVVSAVSTYTRELEKRYEELNWLQQRVISQHVGNIKDRITVPQADIECITGWDTQYGHTFLYKIIDPKGNVFIWKTGTYIEHEKATVVGTVKAHNTYNGEKQTELTRCKVQA